MIALIQLVRQANVVVNEEEIASIQRGIVALIGIEKTDSLLTANKLIEKIINYRIFPDNAGKMNLSLSDVEGNLLLVPQFTLVAETQKGTRPGFSKGMPPHEGEMLFNETVKCAKEHYSRIASGKFGAYMQVNLCNDGPVTFWLQV